MTTLGDSIGLRIQSLPHHAIETFCHKWNVQEFALFGSILTDHFQPESDIDILVSYLPGKAPSLFYLPDMAEELQSILGRKVDLVNRRGIEKSRNHLRRNEILRTARPYYVTG